MSKSKHHNSILVLATLGVYLGLVLVGATPQVLAQAAMTRQFNVKDEVEVKDDLDKEPKRFGGTANEQMVLDIDQKVANSFERFISSFRSLGSTSSVWLSNLTLDDGIVWRRQPDLLDNNNALRKNAPITKILTLTHLPRAGLDSLLASEAN